VWGLPRHQSPSHDVRETTEQGVTPPRDSGAKDTVARPLDGGTLYLVGNARTGEGSSGGATTLHRDHSGSRIYEAR
jgi:hypothetical protein